MKTENAPLRCLLIDDEPPALEILENYINSVENLIIVAQCQNAIEAAGILQSTEIDLIFLDIKMPQLLGTDFLRTLENPPKIIFTSAYREYAIEGFELDAIDYLMKPISLERFLKAINKVLKTDIPNQKQLFQPNTEAFLFFRIDRKMVKVFTNEILYLESLKDYIKIYTTHHPKALIVKKTMNAVEEMLPEDNFMRVHRSFIVAINKVTSFTANTLLIANQKIPIGRLYSQDIRKKVKRE